MSALLTETGWKNELGKAKNAGLRVMKTGVSEKLRDYDKFNQAYLKSRHKSEACKAVTSALTALKKQCEDQANKHKLFTEAGAYLRKVAQEAETRNKAITHQHNVIVKHLTELRQACSEAAKEIIEMENPKFNDQTRLSMLKDSKLQIHANFIETQGAQYGMKALGAQLDSLYTGATVGNVSKSLEAYKLLLRKVREVIESPKVDG